MNTLKKTTLTLVGLGAIATTAFAFADENETMSAQSSQRSPMMQGQERGQFFNQYLRTDLTVTEKASLATVEQTHEDAVKALFATQSGSVTTDLGTQMKALQDQFVTALLPYIATDKQDAFKQAMTTLPQGRFGMMERRGGDNDGDSRMNSGSMANFEATITRTVTNLTNGVQITETTTNSGSLARLQEIYTKGKNQKDLPNSNTSVVRTMLSNGLQTVVTSTDAATVVDIQAKAAKSPAGFGVGLGYFKNGQGEDDQKETRGTNKVNRGNSNTKTTTSTSANLLPSNISPLIDAKLATLSTTEAKLAWLNAINQKVDVLAAKVTAQKSKNILLALKDLLNQKIDAINNVGVDSSIINNLLQ